MSNLKATDSDHQVLESWWQWLDDNSGHRAKLRRADSADDIMMMEPFYSFLYSKHNPSLPLSPAWKEAENFHAAALLCGLLARVKKNSSSELIKERISDDQETLKKEAKQARFSECLAMPNSGGNSPIMSELRFQRLQKSESVELFYLNMCRAIDLLKGDVPIHSMIDDVLLWYKEFQSGLDKEPRNRLAIRWATHYFTTLNHYKLA